MAGPGGKEVGRISIRVVPNTDHFRSELQAQLKAIAKSMEVKIKVTPDLNGFRQKVQAATKGIRTTVGVGANTAGFRSTVTAATRGVPNATIDVDANTAPFWSEVARLRMMVNRPMAARIYIDDRPVLGAVYNVMRLGRTWSNVAGKVVKWGSIITLALGAITPPLTALTAVTAKWGLGLVGAIGGAATFLATGGIAAGFIAAAFAANKVKEAWGEAQASIAATFREANQPVEDGLVQLFPKMDAAVKQMQPSLRRVSEGVAGLIDQFGNRLPAIADELGPTLEKMFESGRPGMEKFIDTMPRIVQSIGNFFETLGNSEAVQSIWSGFIEGIPGAIEKLGVWIDKAARGYQKMKDWLNSDQLKPFRDGLERFAENFKNIDWDRLQQGVEDLMNTFGNWMGEFDVQGFVDDLGKIAGGISNVGDVIGKLGIWGTLGAIIAAQIGAAIIAGLGRAFLKAGAKWLMGKLFGKTADIVDEATEVGVEAAGGLLSGLSNGLTQGLGVGLGALIGTLLGNLFSSDSKDLNVNLFLDSVTWPNGEPGPHGVFIVDSIIWPEGTGGPATGAPGAPGVFNLDLSGLSAQIAAITPLLAQLNASLMPIASTFMQIQGLVSGIAGLFSSLSSTIGGIVGPIVSTLTGFGAAVSSALAPVKSSVEGVVGAWVALYSQVATIIGGLIGFVNNLATQIHNQFATMLDTPLSEWIGGWGEILGTVVAGVDNIGTEVNKIPGLVESAFSAARGMAIASGKALVQGFVDGIRSMLGAVASAAKSVVDAAAQFFPHSPAPEGPFSGRGYTSFSGMALVEDFARGMLSKAPLAAGAAGSVLEQVKQQIDQGVAGAQASVNNFVGHTVNAIRNAVNAAGDAAGVENLAGKWEDSLLATAKVIDSKLDGAFPSLAEGLQNALDAGAKLNGNPLGDALAEKVEDACHQTTKVAEHCATKGGEMIAKGMSAGMTSGSKLYNGFAVTDKDRAKEIRAQVRKDLRERLKAEAKASGLRGEAMSEEVNRKLDEQLPAALEKAFSEAGILASDSAGVAVGQKLAEGIETGVASELTLADVPLEIDLEKQLRIKHSDALVDQLTAKLDQIGNEAGVEGFADKWEDTLKATSQVFDHYIAEIGKKWETAVEESGLGDLPATVAEANANQFMQDLGFSGNGAVPNLIREIGKGLAPKKEEHTHYHVEDVTEAERLQNNRRNREMVGRTRR